MNTMRRCCLMVSFKRMWTSASSFSEGTVSRRSANCLRLSATAVFKTTLGPDTESADPGMRNSNLLPVKAKGEVRLRSVVSFTKWGNTWGPGVMATSFLASDFRSFSTISKTATRSSPINMETMAGGASLPPRR